MGTVIHLLFARVDHPMEDTIRRILYNFEHEGGKISLEERRLVQEIVRPLFDISSVTDAEVFAPRASLLIDLYLSERWLNHAEQARFYGGAGRFNALRRFVSSRVGVLRHQGERTWTDEEIARAKVRAEYLAGFIVNPRDIDKLDQLDWSLPAERRGAHG